MTCRGCWEECLGQEENAATQGSPPLSGHFLSLGAQPSSCPFSIDSHFGGDSIIYINGAPQL